MRQTIVAAALLAFGIGNAQAKQLHVVASFTILADIARNVGGDKVEVATLVGPNGDPHTFEPTPADATKLKTADVVLVNGLGLEGWMDRLIAASGTKDVPIIVSKGVSQLKMDEDGKTAIDPHAWNDARNGALYAQNIAEAFAAADPDDAATFAANAKVYETKIDAVNAQAKAAIAAVPVDHRKILTTHDALGYFAKAYGVEILSPLGISTEQEPSASSMAALIGQIKTQHIKTYFLENSNDPRLIRQIAAATGAEPGGELYVESLSPAGGPAATYLDMMRHNIDLIVHAMREQA